MWSPRTAFPFSEGAWVPWGWSTRHQKLLRTLPALGAAAAGSLRVCSTAPWWSRPGRGPVSSPTGLYPARSKAAAFRAIQVNGQREPRKPISGIVEPKTSLPLAPPAPPACSCSRCDSGASARWGSGFQAPGCFLRPEPGSCWEPQTEGGRCRRHTCCLWRWKSWVWPRRWPHMCVRPCRILHQKGLQVQPRGWGVGTCCRLWPSYCSSKKAQRRAPGSWGSLDLRALPWTRQVLVRELLLPPPSWEPTAVSLAFYLPAQALDWKPEAEAPPFSPQGTSPVLDPAPHPHPTPDWEQADGSIWAFLSQNLALGITLLRDPVGVRQDTGSGVGWSTVHGRVHRGLHVIL